MNTHKYITIANDAGQPEILVFPARLCHADVAVEAGRKVLSAGFIDFPTRRCHGESLSLGKQADELRDTALLRALFNARGERLDNLPPMLQRQAC